MFYFGSTEDIVSLYFSEATSEAGPAIPGSALDEMSEEELEVFITYRRIAYRAAARDEAPQEVRDRLLDAYDEVFKRLVSVSDRFRIIVGTGLHRPITGYSPESINKYRMLAGHRPLTDIV